MTNEGDGDRAVESDKRHNFKSRLARARVWFVIHIAFVVLGFALAIRNPKGSFMFIYGIVFLAFMSAMRDLRDILALRAGDDPDDH